MVKIELSIWHIYCLRGSSNYKGLLSFAWTLSYIYFMTLKIILKEKCVGNSIVMGKKFWWYFIININKHKLRPLYVGIWFCALMKKNVTFSSVLHSGGGQGSRWGNSIWKVMKITNLEVFTDFLILLPDTESCILVPISNYTHSFSDI